MKRITHAAALTAALLMTGCQTYERQPLELNDYMQRWREVDTSAAANVAVRLSDVPFDISDGVSLAEAKALALALNPDLRVARLRAAVPLAGSKHAGLLDDPELGFDVLRIVENVDKPWIAGVGIGFTIPLSGRLAVEKDQAWADYSAAWRRVALQESETITRVEQAWSQWTASNAHLALIVTHINRLEPLASTAKRLSDAGELRPIDARRVELTLADARADLLKAKSTTGRIRGDIFALLGLVPDAGATLAIDVVDSSAPGVDAPHEALVRHPRLELAKASYEVVEQNLRREITKQYPDLTIGPVYENEEDQSRIGLGGAIPIPVFNRNRRGIAEAGATRDAARAEAEHTYQRLAAEYDAARRAHQTARDRLAYLSGTVAPLVEQQLTGIDGLINIGEVDVLALTDAFDRQIAVRADTIDANTAAAQAAATLRSLLKPVWITIAARRDDNDTDQVQP